MEGRSSSQQSWDDGLLGDLLAREEQILQLRSSENSLRRLSPHLAKRSREDFGNRDNFDDDVDDAALVAMAAAAEDRNAVSHWLPAVLADAYAARGVVRLYDWQRDALSLEGVAAGTTNLVYSAPTSGGKTMVAEIIALRRCIHDHKKAMVLVPSVALADEKSRQLSALVQKSGMRVEGYYRSRGSGFENPIDEGGAHIAVCTIEKSYHLLNRVIENGTHRDLRVLVIDESHMLGTEDRGALLEGIVAKLLYLKLEVQFVFMSATLPNLHVFTSWLNAKVFITRFRPVPLDEKVLLKGANNTAEACVIKVQRDVENTGGGARIVERTLKKLKPRVVSKPAPPDAVLWCWSLCVESLRDGKSTLLFARSRAECESNAARLSELLVSEGLVVDAGAATASPTSPSPSSSNGSDGTQGRPLSVVEQRERAVARLIRSSGGCSEGLKKCLLRGVAYHHAGLTSDERFEVERGYKKGYLQFLVATSTLAIGVNLPAARVIFLHFQMGTNDLTPIDYMQMSGRAGRAGIDKLGESFVYVESENQLAKVMNIIRSPPAELSSALLKGTNLQALSRMLLDCISRGLVQNMPQLAHFMQQTLLSRLVDAQQLDAAVSTVLTSLESQQFCTVDKESGRIKTSPLGVAVSLTWMTPMEARFMLQLVQECGTHGFVFLGTPLHYCYLIAPLVVGADLIPEEAPRKLFRVLKSNPAEKKVLYLVFGGETEVARAETLPRDYDVKIRRLYCAKIVSEMLQERDLVRFAREYDVNMSAVQKLMEASSTMASQMVPFLNLLGPEYAPISAALQAFIPRLEQGVQPELCELMRIPKMSRIRARALYNAGIVTLDQLRDASADHVYEILQGCEPWRDKHRVLRRDLAEIIERKQAKAVIRAAGEVLFMEAIADDAAAKRAAELYAKKEKERKMRKVSGNQHQ